MYLFGHAFMSIYFQSCRTYIMSNVCCKEFKGWCRAFTRTELLLCVLQAILLIAFTALLTFLTLHFVICLNTKPKKLPLPEPIVTNIEYFTTTENVGILTNVSLKDYELNNKSNNSVSTDLINTTIKQHITVKHTEVVAIPTASTAASTLDKGISCTWQPSEKTDATIHYYEDGRTSAAMTEVKITNTAAENPRIKSSHIDIINKGREDNILGDIPDGEVAGDEEHFLLALVKIKTPQDVIFGCTLTVIGGYWALTAASCILAIEEVDSLDGFVIMQGFKRRYLGSINSIADVIVHPLFQGVNATYDLAALKSGNNLIENGISPVTLPSLLDYFLVTVGERLTMLGYGGIRSTGKAPLSGAVRRVWARRLPLGRCARRLPAGPLCAGVLGAAAAACGYCAGTPLLLGRTLLAVMADNQHCGLACSPVLFANLALARDWLDSFLYS